MSVVLYRLGGTHVAEFAHAALSMPGIATTRRHCTTSIHASPAFPTLDEMRSNIATAFQIDAPSNNQVVSLVCMIVEIKVEEVLDWCLHTNSVIGLCREHSGCNAHAINNIDDVHTLFDDLANRKVHFGMEATVAAIGALTGNHRQYIARPFLISATCKNEKADKHADLLRLACSACNQMSKETKGSVYCLASDGESRRGKALVALMEHTPLSPTSRLYAYLGGLPLLNLLVGEDELTSDKDYKHVMKRLRHTHLRPSGVSVGGVQITPSVLQSHLEGNKYPSSQINNLMNVTDKQDITTMFNLMLLIWKLPPPLTTDNPIYYKTHVTLNQHSKLVKYLILPYINVDMSLHDQLKSLSAVAHLAYIFFTDHNAHLAYLPSPLYRDIQIMVKNVFFCVAKMKCDNPNGEFFLILLGMDRLEWIFVLIRSQNGRAIECHSILSQHPEWDRGPRRLRLQGLSATTGIEQKIDHLNLALWKGDMQVSGIQLMSAWRSGRHEVENDPELTAFSPAEKFGKLESTPGADLLNPFGMEVCEDGENEETYNETPQQPNPDSTIPIVPDSLELEELVDNEDMWKNGLESTIDVGNGKHVHKAKVLHEFTRFTRTSNSTDQLRRVANISRFAQIPATPHHHIGDGSIMETECILIQDPVATLLRCEGIPFLGVAQVSSIKVDKSSQSGVSKDLLNKETVTIGLQILCLKSQNIILSNGKDGDWVWQHGRDASIVVPSKFIQQINPDVVTVEEESAVIRAGIRRDGGLRKAVEYGFRSDELRELAAVMFGALSLDD
ncbi:uncharacterized protein EI90DRAFT_3018097 [Cantharellus anzutake]|uniref:uncharacterized protein n=1 Tax=Cantharellus anzutake TaxID=1750568 RepID=UPI001904C55E|nr:uncharacterized protein EI90DRAFT_3018097 [Cantharellus anzutake]KAF8327604.1 hypothetical protein EI90DRAFT_3018097 [Cantharellus anzutake]